MGCMSQLGMTSTLMNIVVAKGGTREWVFGYVIMVYVNLVFLINCVFFSKIIFIFHFYFVLFHNKQFFFFFRNTLTVKHTNT